MSVSLMHTLSVSYAAPLARPTGSSTVRMAIADASKALPMLSRPEMLTGSMIGDVGFDPIGLSKIDGEYINLRWMREAEIKHGRVCMLATAGWLAVDLGFKLPGDKYAGLTSLTAHEAMVSTGDMTMMLVLVALLEAKMGPKIFEAAGVPGDYGWDPMGMGKGAKADKDAALKELKNGRLAMIAWAALVSSKFIAGSVPGLV
mmetsp:Transcript_47258/g.110326  ORF Transcript_47258/g.110326 Transcript_47258/m.110326 type:complete len:202 (+) Transcript_47258:34-639(+)